MSDSDFWEALRRQIQPFSDPKLQEALRRQIQPFSDPKLQEALRKQIQPFSDPKLQEALRKQIQPFSDPKVQEALRRQIQPFGDPRLRAALLTALEPIAPTAFGSAIRDGLADFRDANLITEIQSETEGDNDVSAALGLVLEAEAALEVGAADNGAVDEAAVRAWVASLSDEQVLSYAVTTCDVLTGLLLLVAVLTPGGGVVAVVAAAADVLLRVARPLLEVVNPQRHGRDG